MHLSITHFNHTLIQWGYRRKYISIELIQGEFASNLATPNSQPKMPLFDNNLNYAVFSSKSNVSFRVKLRYSIAQTCRNMVTWF